MGECERKLQGCEALKNTKLRVARIVPNVFCYLMLMSSLIFVIINSKGIVEIGKMSVWIILLLALFLISVFGSIRIWYWIVKGKM